MPFAAALSTVADTRQAASESCSQAIAQLGSQPDLAFVFFSSHHAENVGAVRATATRLLRARCLLGCSAESVVGNDREIEHSPALAVWLARWDRPVQFTPFHLSLERTADGPALLGWPDELTAGSDAFVLTLGDPFTFPVELMFQLMDREHRGLRVMGGMASGGRAPGEGSLLLNDRLLDQGAVAVLVRGPVTLRGVVSQGCRPIGEPMIVTKAQERLLLELGGRPAGERLKELWEALCPHDRVLVQRGLHLGRVINEYQADFRRGDFLVRNVVGFDERSGAIAITDQVRVGQTVQFHVRDAVTADEDLHELLNHDLRTHEKKPAGALLFTCNGRGRNLFDQPDHDASVIRQETGPIPLAGFFAQGEFGPVGGQNFIHGFTASVALFED
jgi:small ligand-binding sensory domain FIST